MRQFFHFSSMPLRERNAFDRKIMSGILVYNNEPYSIRMCDIKFNSMVIIVLFFLLTPSWLDTVIVLVPTVSQIQLVGCSCCIFCHIIFVWTRCHYVNLFRPCYGFRVRLVSTQDLLVIFCFVAQITELKREEGEAGNTIMYIVNSR